MSVVLILNTFFDSNSTKKVRFWKSEVVGMEKSITIRPFTNIIIWDNWFICTLPDIMHIRILYGRLDIRIFFTQIINWIRSLLKWQIMGMEMGIKKCITMSEVFVLGWLSMTGLLILFTNKYANAKSLNFGKYDKIKVFPLYAIGCCWKKSGSFYQFGHYNKKVRFHGLFIFLF